jgi:hypothetical protein
MEAPAPIDQTESARPEKDASDKKTKVKSIDGALIAEIGSNGNIDFSGKKLTSKRKNSEKIKYLVDGNEIAEVKTKDADGFKVRDLNGNLLWKIKLSAEKIKISDNEENKNPFEIKKSYDGAKIKHNDEKIGEIKFDSETQKIKIKGREEKVLFETRAVKQTSAYGVLILEKIPEVYRYIIISELLSRNL